MNNQSLQARYNRRAFKDRLVRYFVASGGISVIVAILLIFFYLLYVVVPMFAAADIELSASYSAPGEGKTLHLGLEEQGTIGVRFTDNGHVIFFDAQSGEIVNNQQLNLPAPIIRVSPEEQSPYPDATVSRRFIQLFPSFASLPPFPTK